MPWNERKVNDMRKEFVEEVLAHKGTKAELCRKYAISRPTGDKWIKRYLAGDDLTDLSRAPHSTPKRISPEMEVQIVAWRRRYPAIGALKLRKMMENAGIQALPCAKTFNNVLARNGLITKEASQKATPYLRYEKETPNEMWQADYKGHFALGTAERCHPLNIIDDASRFNLCCEAMRGETFEEIKPVLTRVFLEYGMPFSFLCDNGNPWGTVQSTGYSRFEVWLMELGVLTLHGRAYHPQTQGKEERFNQSMKRELLNGHKFNDFAEAQAAFDGYRNFYNLERPHFALEMATPASCYTKSSREFPARIEPWTYPKDVEIRRVKSTGYFNYDGQGYFLSESFGGKDIAVRPSQIPHCISLFFRQFRIGRIDVEKRVFTFKRIYLIEGDPRAKKDSTGADRQSP